jgi:D-glycero-D-manno-heptose 1,7-bisphosphate phosphatase
MNFPVPKALILDRDGTLLEHVPYLHEVEKVRLLPDVAEALRLAQHHGALLFLHTNQSGVGRGYFPLEAAHSCNDRMIAQLDIGENPFERICIATETPDEDSLYRKPSPLFAREICAQWQLSPSELCYIGDNASDLATADAAGTNGVGLTTGLHDIATDLKTLQLSRTYSIFTSLLDACQFLFASPHE